MSEKRKMVYRCIVKFCESSSDSNPSVKSSIVPAFGTKRFDDWCKALGERLEPGRHFICHKHFTDGDFAVAGLSRHAIPSAKLSDDFSYSFEFDEGNKLNREGTKYTYSKECVLKRKSSPTIPVQELQEYDFGSPQKSKRPRLSPEIEITCNSCPKAHNEAAFWRKKYLAMKLTKKNIFV